MPDIEKPLRDDLQKMSESLQLSLNNLQSTGTQVSLVNADGSVNRAMLQQVINSRNFRQWRKENPELLKAAKKAERSFSDRGAASLSQDALRVGLGLSQMRQSREINQEVPLFPDDPRRDQVLSQEIGRTQGLAESGLSPLERARLRADADRTYRSTAAQIAQASGGQAGAAMSNLQAASLGRMQAGQQIQGMAEQQAQRERSNLNQLLGQRAAETDMIRRHQTHRFVNRDYPQARIRQQAAERLMNAGITNMATGVDDAFGDLADMSATFGSDAPGYVRFDSDNKAIRRNGKGIQPYTPGVGPIQFDSGNQGLGAMYNGDNKAPTPANFRQNLASVFAIRPESISTGSRILDSMQDGFGAMPGILGIPRDNGYTQGIEAYNKERIRNYGPWGRFHIGPDNY